MYQIGLFQGCPLTVVLFLIVFNLLLDLLKTKEHLGYQLKNTNIRQLQKAYADDLTLIARTKPGLLTTGGDIPRVDQNDEDQAL